MIGGQINSYFSRNNYETGIKLEVYQWIIIPSKKYIYEHQLQSDFPINNIKDANSRRKGQVSTKLNDQL